MKVVTTFHQSSSVSHSLKCQLSPHSDLEYLVVAKLDRLEVFSLQSDGLKHECKLEIWGKVVSLRSIPIEGSNHSNLLVMTDHPDPEVLILTYSQSDEGDLILKTIKHLPLFERTARPAEFLNDVLVDPMGRIAIVSCYAGKLKIITLDHGKYKSDFDVSIKELTLLALSFIFLTPGDHALAILHMDNEQHPQLLSREIHIEDLELSPSPSTILPSTPLSTKSFSMIDTETLPVIISVPDHGDDADDIKSTQGVLVVGGRKVLYFELASYEWQGKQKGKQRRAEARKKSSDKAEANKAKEKEKERANRKRKPKASVEWPWSEVTAWCPIDQQCTRYLLGDSFGRLAMLSLDSMEEKGLVLLPLGEISPATTLTYLTSQVLYVGSHFGDSQLIQIHASPITSLESLTLPIPPDVSTASPSSHLVSSGKGKDRIGDESKPDKGTIIAVKGSYLSVLETFKNIAPILDAALVNTDGVGQREIITCSGGRNTGSVNVIRNGADFHEHAFLEGLQNVTNIWPVRSTFQSSLDTLILASTLHGTSLVRIDGGNGISRVPVSSTGFITNMPTLAAGNISRYVPKGTGQTASYADSSLVIQVTPKGISLLDLDVALGQYTLLDNWTPDRMADARQGGNPTWKGKGVVAAGINASQFVLALSGARLVLLGLDGHDKFQVKQWSDVGDFSLHAREISAVSCTPLDLTKNFSTLIAVSFWGSNHVSMFSLANTEGRIMAVCRSPQLPSLPRSLLLHNFGSDRSSKGADYRPHLLVGLGDGSVVSFSFRDKQLSDQNIISLGETPVFMVPCEADGMQTVFACGTRASIFFWDKERLRHSPVILKDVVTASRLHTPTYSSCLILATPTGLSIGKVKDLDKMHVRSVPLGFDTPRRIKYHPALKAFGVACVRTEPTRVGDAETTVSSFKLIDGASLDCLGHFQFEDDHEVTAVESLEGHSVPYFCVGTVCYEPEEEEPREGRLVLFRANSVESRSSNLHLSVATSTEVRGCVYALASLNGMIAAAINTSVNLFRVDGTDDPALHKVADWDHNYFVTSLVSRGNNLLLGDAISSISLLKVEGARIETVAKDYGPLWPVCVEILDDMSVIGANSDCNLFTFSLQTTEMRTVLQRDGSYHIADAVNKFLPASPDSSKDLALEPKQMFFTSSGRIGVIIDMGRELSLQMSALERNMANVITGAGGMSHTRFRAPKNARGRSDAQTSSVGFLDGDFIEQFLHFLPSSPTLEHIWSGQHEAERLTIPVDQIQKVVETLQSMH